MILHTLSSPITSPTTEFSKNFPKIWRALPPLTQFSKIIHGLRVAVRIFKNYPRVARVPNFQILNTGCECTQPPRPRSPPFLSIPGPEVFDFDTRKIEHRPATPRTTVRDTATIPPERFIVGVRGDADFRFYLFLIGLFRQMKKSVRMPPPRR